VRRVLRGLGGSNPPRSSGEAGETKNEKGPETVEAAPAVDQQEERYYDCRPGATLAGRGPVAASGKCGSRPGPLALRPHGDRRLGETGIRDRRIDFARAEYSTRRPHSAVGYRPPAPVAIRPPETSTLDGANAI
jgi:hypothetical protein